MNNSRWAQRSALVVTAGLAVAAAGLPAWPASAQTSTTGPMVKLIAAQKNINVARYGRRVFINPGLYVTAVGSPLQFNVQRASYAKPLTITQILRVPGSAPVLRPLPAWTLEGWRGLHRFIRLTLKNSAGQIVASRVGPFCPNGFTQRSSPNAPASSRFPFWCDDNPFQLGDAWGIQRGWGVQAGFLSARIPLGKYTLHANITGIWRRFLHLTTRASTATVNIKVVKPSSCRFPNPCAAASRPRVPGTTRGILPSLPANVPSLSDPPAASLPDLAPLPSFGIRIFRFRNGTSFRNVLTFGATVWTGGNSRLDVEGFRSHGSPTMKAYQYFWKNGRIIGRTRAGTMGFDTKAGHTHWHFQQFAAYRLLNKSKTSVLRSRKVGFCIAPTDFVNLLLPHALWQPTFRGFGGACGEPSALWVQEMMPIGWGDTYGQFLPGQAFDVTNLPNGTYYIEVIANPGKLLHESNLRNDVSLRKVILGGTSDHRTVKVPAVHGIDPEHMGG